MAKNSRKNVSSLYPTPKSYEELSTERLRRYQKRRPRFVEVKIGIGTAFGFVTILAGYNLIAQMMLGDISFGGHLLFSVSVSFLVLIITGAVLFLIFSFIDSLATSVLRSRSLLYWVVLPMVTILTGLIVQHFGGHIGMVTVAIFFNFLGTIAGVNFILKH